MKIYEISYHDKDTGFDNYGQVEYKAAEKKEDLNLGKNETAEEIGDASQACHSGSMGYYKKGDDEMCYDEYIAADGTIIDGDSGKDAGEIDIERTNAYNEKEGFNEFDAWEFDLWMTRYWDGSNWKIVCIDKNSGEQI